MSGNNYLNLCVIEFVEFTSSEPQKLDQLFLEFGFSRVMKHKEKDISYYNQNDIHFLLNMDQSSYANKFNKLHGPSICSMGWRVADAQYALEQSLERGAIQAEGDFFYLGKSVSAIKGIGDSLIYFIQDFDNKDLYSNLGFIDHDSKEIVPSKGFICIDHLTNNVEKGTMSTWSDFYKNVFGFTEVRYFDIRGAKTGLTSFALKSPCGTFCIPINEATDKKSQINEYIEEYNGPGIQHLAFTTHDIVQSLDKLDGTSIKTLDIENEYYDDILERVPNVTEKLKDLSDRKILIDGDIKGYLLQIFTKNVIGPIFIEIIQRKNHYSFGEGNFGALFRSIERDQEERGYLK